MRDRKSWYQPVTEALRPWPAEHEDVKPALLCQVELGLRLLERLSPGLPADSVWPLLGGYPFAAASGLAPTGQEQQMVTNARHLLWTLRRHRTWEQSLAAYRGLPERLRAYRVPEDGVAAVRTPLFVAADRFDAYDDALEHRPALDQRALRIAGEGEQLFVQRRHQAQVTLPAELVLPLPPGHDLLRPPAHLGPLEVPLAELAETAHWMDEREARRPAARRGNWARRLADLRLDVRSADGLGFEAATALRLDRLVHLVGMVGAGKSTLMTLIAVWGARRGLRTTLVVGDVAEQLNTVQVFRALGLAAAPVLGGSMRERHVQRLHRRIAGRSGLPLLLHDDPGFADLSTVCVLDAQRGVEAIEPLRYADAPCTSLYPVGTARKQQDSDAETGRSVGRFRHGSAQGPSAAAPDRPSRDLSGERHGCPIWGACPRHGAARELVDALIWVANPASLVHSPVPRHLNAERLRYLELACLRSDIVIVDEVDRVQMNLDDAFAPTATLVIRGPESWLDRLHTQKIDELSRAGRIPLSDRDVALFNSALSVVSAAADRLYETLISDREIREWADLDYFSPWTLQEKLLEDWYPSRRWTDAPPETVRDEAELYEEEDDAPEDLDDAQPAAADLAPTPWATRRTEVTDVFDIFRDDPLGDLGPYGDVTDELVRAAHDLLHRLDPKRTRTRIRALLARLLAGAPALDGDASAAFPHPAFPPETSDRGTENWLERNAQRLEFMLLLGALNQRLSRLTFLWPQVEAALHLDAADNELSRRPPLDYAPLVPESPMGNVLGFQYLPDEPDGTPEAEGRYTGTLRFFRCAGVGRELLHALPELGPVGDPLDHPADPAARPGPRVLLMSGTSWAGTSTRAHVLAPVQAVLKPNEKALEAIRQTSFRTDFQYHRDGRPISLSGQRLELRAEILRELIGKLARSERLLTPSPLERELAQISDPRRRRALLLVGSYRDAVTVAARLEEIPRWQGRVRVLVKDDAELEEQSEDPRPGADRQARPLRRGDLASFAEDEEAELLVAPLLAVERGHNILSTARTPNEERVAAFGTVFFLVRPHPRPDDLSLAVLAVNDWVTRFTRDLIPHPEAGTFSNLVTKASSLSQAGLTFRRIARAEWRRLLTRRYIWSRLSPTEQQAFAWDQLVTIWQVIGRLVRGGVPARVVFVDAAFAPALAESLAPPPQQDAELYASSATRPGRRRRRTDSGLLARLREVLAPYFASEADPTAFTDPADPALVRMLYQPLYDALCRMNTGPLPERDSDDPHRTDTR
ncbi:pPIWI_RE_Z domain-containing protein [Kitasatospora sp. NPDC004289]